MLLDVTKLGSGSVGVTSGASIQGREICER